MGSSASTIPPEAPDGEELAPAGPRLLLFAVGGRVYGAELSAVREIIPFRPPTRLPGAPAYVVGLINVRGTIVTVMDLGLRLGGAGVDREAGSIVLMEHGSTAIGVAVDDVRDVQSLDDGALDASAGDADSQEGLVRGVGRAGGGLVVVLDVQAMIGKVLL